MDRREKGKKNNVVHIGASRAEEARKAARTTHNNAKVRNTYRTDPEVREKTKERSRQHYQRTFAKSETGRLREGLLHPPVNRTVRAHTAATEILRCYTLTEAAKALGRDHKTFRRWIKDGSIPEPLLVDDHTGYRQYSLSEVNIIREELNEHEDRGYLYLFAEHEMCIRQIANRINVFRRTWCNF